jgi:hypothetical protein
LEAQASFTSRVVEVDDNIVEWFAEVPLLEQDTANHAIRNARRIPFAKQCREIQSPNTIFKRKTCATSKLG